MVFQIILKVLDGVEVRVNDILPHQTVRTISLWASVCTWGHCHVEIGKVLKVAIKLEAQHCLKYVALRLDLRSDKKHIKVY